MLSLVKLRADSVSHTVGVHQHWTVTAPSASSHASLVVSWTGKGGITPSSQLGARRPGEGNVPESLCTQGPGQQREPGLRGSSALRETQGSTRSPPRASRTLQPSPAPTSGGQVPPDAWRLKGRSAWLRGPCQPVARCGQAFPLPTRPNPVAGSRHAPQGGRPQPHPGEGRHAGTAQTGC